MADIFIAVVDDDDSVRESLHSLLRSMGYAVKTFVSAEEFLNFTGFDKTDSLILDVRMPGMTGIELQALLIVRGYRIPIIFVTADSKDGIRKQALDRGAIAFLPKPLNEETVISALKIALKST